ncbi:HD domain-containing phosphohydrolase [Pleomorphomonas sp. PLEO]|uniref:HD domain-containing phosphohydrolase n=1 Tax=Pleomorphomonas sp. PLEO TaxID=3239306 RepID=UPI00351F3CC0
MNIYSLRVRIAGLAGLCIIGATTAIIAVNTQLEMRTADFVSNRVSELLDQTGRESIMRLAGQQASVVSAELNVAWDAARNMAKAFETTMVAPDKGGAPIEARRAQLNGFLERVLRDTPRLNGTYSAWMPNALDGRDSAFKGDRAVGADDTGRALPYLTRDSAGHIALQPLVDYDNKDFHTNGVMKGGWFIGPHETGRESLEAPLPYIVQGRPVFLATISVPIIIGGKFAGVAGTDFDLAFFQHLVESAKAKAYSGKGEVTIVTDKGLIVASSLDPTAIGESLSKIDGNWQSDIKIVAGGQEAAIQEDNSDQMHVFAPIEIGRTGAHWSIIIAIPRQVVMAEALNLSNALSERAKAGLFWQIVASISIAAAATIGMILVGQTIAAPIVSLAGVLRRIASGETVGRIDGTDRRDEVGEIAAASEILRQGLAEAERLREAEKRLSTLAEQLDAEVEQKTFDLADREREIIWRLARATERRDSETGDHISRMARISGFIAKALGLSEEECLLMELAAPMHDIGKVGVPDEVLFKPGAFTAQERRIMEKHTVLGWEILKDSKSKLIQIAAEIALSHHERWDGEGYPHRLSGKDIPLGGRIAAVADVFDALTSVRPYKSAWTLEDARALIETNAGKHFDPDCVAAFLAAWKDVVAVVGTSPTHANETVV